jgi:hypothetical protein
MEKKTLFLYSAFVALAYFIFKIVIFYAEIDFEMNSLFPALPILIIITGVLAFMAYQLPDTNDFLIDFKFLASFGLLTSVLISVLIYIYYSAFDVDYFSLRISESEYALRQMENMTEEKIATQLENMRFLFTPFRYAALTLSGFTFFSLMVSGMMSAGKWFFKRIAP